MRTRQVDKSHYGFSRYMTKRKWNSVWHQLDEVIRLKPTRVLEVGPGAGLFKRLASHYGLHVETLDLDPELEPDYVGSATKIPQTDAAFDAVCAFQVLEHLPYPESLIAFGEMVRVSSRNILISLPDSRPTWRYSGHIPTVGKFDRLVPKPFSKAKEHKFDGQHYWEINKSGYSLDKVIADFSKGLRLLKHFQVKENPYHRFFVFEKP